MGDASVPPSGPLPPPPAGPFPPPPPGPNGASHPPLTPTEEREREPILDVLRGFASLGILLVNIEFMRGSGVYATLLGVAAPAPGTTLDRVTSFAVGWLISGKFVSAFAIMFGLGAALIARRSLDAGRSPRGLLARRYGWLLGFGLAHMLLLFPGDVLFVYGVTGMVLLFFVFQPTRVLLAWAGGLLLVATVLFAPLAAVAVPDAAASATADPFTAAMASQLDQAASAYLDGSYGEVIRGNATLSLLVQSGQVGFLPWFLGLFLFGFALGRSGLVQALAERRPLLRRAAIVGLGIGLPVNLVLGVLGPLGTGEPGTAGWLLVAGTVVQLLGAPLLSVGYLAGLALLGLRWGTIGPLAAVGRMALSAYLLQSVLALVVFWGLGYYGQLGAAEALVVVVGIWCVVAAVSVVWLRFFRFGPVEWVWRSLTYGQLPPLRART